MKELKNVKDVLKNVLRFVRRLNLKDGKAEGYVRINRDGNIALQICIKNPSYFFVLMNYYSDLRQQIEQWTKYVNFTIRIVCDDSGPIRCENNFFEFSPKPKQVLRFKKIKHYRGCEVPDSGYFDINLINLD